MMQNAVALEQYSLPRARARAALQLTFVADALSMPVHWYYNPLDIVKAFPQGIIQFEAAPEVHPSSIMSLHSTQQGGRGAQPAQAEKHIVGDVILKGKRQYWGLAQQHYHRGLPAGENTLNAHCARLVMRSLYEAGNHYDANLFLKNYIAFMMADPPQHPDTYAESYHRGFFANYIKGIDPKKCGAATHDTASVGGLVTIAPIALSALLQNQDLVSVQKICREHLWLTHPDEKLAYICAAYVRLINSLLFREDGVSATDLIAETARASVGVDLEKLVASHRDDNEVVGHVFSKACYIEDSWPSLLYLAYKYNSSPKTALLANTNVGGENCHRGSVLGVLLGLSHADGLNDLFVKLISAESIAREINDLLAN